MNQIAVLVLLAVPPSTSGTDTIQEVLMFRGPLLRLLPWLRWVLDDFVLAGWLH